MNILSKFFDFSVKRSGIGIFWFYLFHSILGSIVAGIICGVLVFIILSSVPGSSFDGGSFGIKYGPLLAMLYGVGMAIAIMYKKRILNSYKAVLLTIIAVPLLYFFGFSLGFIPVSFITSFESNNVE